MRRQEWYELKQLLANCWKTWAFIIGNGLIIWIYLHKTV